MKNYCTKCGKENKNKTDYCEYCGEIMKPEIEVVKNVKVVKTNAFALAGFITGIASLVLNFFCIGSIVAIILSSIGLHKIKNDEGSGRNYALAGLIIGIFELASAVSIVLVIIFLGLINR